MYLEAGWSDYLLAARNAETPGLVTPNPMSEWAGPSFYREIAEWVAAVCPTETVSTLCEIGAAVGRGVFELDRALPGLTKIVAVEPSRVFGEWLEHLLVSEAPLPAIPINRLPGVLDSRPAKSRPAPIEQAAQRLEIQRMPMENYLGNRQPQFDLVFCANVLDRHPRPQRFLSTLVDLVSPGKLLVIATPFDYSEALTPVQTEWLFDLEGEIKARASFETLAKREFCYDFRYHDRSWSRFVSEGICLRRLA